jgi:hypothetical protein
VSLKRSDLNIIKDSIIASNSQDGILLEDHCLQNNISSNHIAGNNYCGIRLIDNSNYNASIIIMRKAIQAEKQAKGPKKGLRGK